MKKASKTLAMKHITTMRGIIIMNLPMMPLMRAKGRKAQEETITEASTGITTSRDPSSAAWTGSLPISR